MTKLLHINSSLSGEHSSSSKMAGEFVTGFLSRHPDAEVVKRDLGVDPVPHLDSDALYAFFNPGAELNHAQQEALDRSNALIKDVQNANILVFGLPMYNFGVPSSLKAWLDHIVRARVTFQYADDGGSIGYLTEKKAYVFASRGGFYAGTERDVQTDFFTRILAFVGITDITYVYAEGMAISPEQAETALANASADIANLVAAS